MGEKKTVTIGVIGAGPGCGVTHFTLLYANHLAAVERRRTAVLEWGRSHAIGKLCRVCTGKERGGEGADSGPVRILEVDYLTDSRAKELAWCQKEGYDQILLDLGDFKDADQTAFLQCTEKYFLGALNEWKLDELLAWEEQMRGGKGHWTFLAAFGSGEARREIRRRFGISFGQIPYAPDVFTIERGTALFFKGLRNGKR